MGLVVGRSLVGMQQACCASTTSRNALARLGRWSVVHPCDTVPGRRALSIGCRVLATGAFCECC
jgi:hypothetical protein